MRACKKTRGLIEHDRDGVLRVRIPPERLDRSKVTRDFNLRLPAVYTIVTEIFPQVKQTVIAVHQHALPVKTEHPTPETQCVSVPVLKSILFTFNMKNRTSRANVRPIGGHRHAYNEGICIRQPLKSEECGKRPATQYHVLRRGHLRVVVQSNFRPCS